MYENYLSERSLVTPPSFIRNILKVTQSDDIISFAGGLPNPISFPQKALNESMDRVVSKYKEKVFQYSTTAGIVELREYIAEKYRRLYGMDINCDNVIVTTGSQQALDLIAKVFINKGDGVIVEEPGYLGAIQAFSQYEPSFCPVSLQEDGLNIDELELTLKNNKVKLMYLVPNFQNPTGITYSKEKREKIYELVKKYNVVLVEDDPYGELRFEGDKLPYIGGDKLETGIVLGSFSKIVTPGMRTGYLISKNEVFLKYINTAKEAADLHTNVFSQYVICDYLNNNDVDSHISEIKDLYRNQCRTMIESMEKYFPSDISFTRPNGGMFIWATMKEGKSAMKLFDKAIEKKVAFVPGNPFYTDAREANTMRLNYTNASENEIIDGIKRLAEVLK